MILFFFRKSRGLTSDFFEVMSLFPFSWEANSAIEQKSVKITKTYMRLTSTFEQAFNFSDFPVE